MWVTPHATPTTLLHQCRSNNAITVLSPAEAVRSRVPEFGAIEIQRPNASFLSGLSCWPTRNDQHKSLGRSGETARKRHDIGWHRMTSDDIGVASKDSAQITWSHLLRRSPTATAAFQPGPKNSEPTLPRIASISSVLACDCTGTVSDTASSKALKGFT